MVIESVQLCPFCQQAHQVGDARSAEGCWTLSNPIFGIFDSLDSRTDLKPEQEQEIRPRESEA
jgi:hypothetical protein